MNGKRGFLRHSLPSVSSWGGGYGYTNKHTNKQLYLRRLTHNSSSTDELVALDPQSTIIRSKMHLRIIKLVDRSIIIYIISSVMHAFWLVLTYDLLEDRRIDDVIIRTSVTHSAAPRVPLFCSYHILTSSVIYYWTDARQLGIYLLNKLKTR